jgi:hypothetical protein
MNCHAHVVSLPFIVQCPGQSVNRPAPGPDQAQVIVIVGEAPALLRRL